MCFFVDVFLKIMFLGFVWLSLILVFQYGNSLLCIEGQNCIHYCNDTSDGCDNSNMICKDADSCSITCSYVLYLFEIIL